jgi:hypothetical protein
VPTSIIRRPSPCPAPSCALRLVHVLAALAPHPRPTRHHRGVASYCGQRSIPWGLKHTASMVIRWCGAICLTLRRPAVRRDLQPTLPRRLLGEGAGRNDGAQRALPPTRGGPHLVSSRTPPASALRPSKKDTKFAHSAFYSCISTGMHGPTCIFWGNLTPSSLQPRATWQVGVKFPHCRRHCHASSCPVPARASRPE